MLRNQGMNQPSCVVVAVDVGSTSARAAVFDAHGLRLGRAAPPFATARPLPDHAEHSSDEIWGAVRASVRAALAAAGGGAILVKGHARIGGTSESHQNIIMIS